MKGRIFDTLVAAESAQLAVDASLGLPRQHLEGDGPSDFVIRNPGEAAGRIRARGVRTEHRLEVVRDDSGARFALLDPAGPDEIPLETWISRPRRGTP